MSIKPSILVNLKPYRGIILGLIVLGLLFGSYEGAWKQGAKKVIKPINELEGNYLIIIWDASGSMWGRAAGVEKIIRSREVLSSLTRDLPKDMQLGLRIFGARRVGDLKDSFLAVSLETEDRSKIINYIANVRPLGKSPIGFSLDRAVEDLSKVSGNRNILLISDGLDNGTYPPRSTINNMKKQEITLYIVHIGELDNLQLCRELRQIARETGGDYFTYNNHDQVVSVFSNN